MRPILSAEATWVNFTQLCASTWVVQPEQRPTFDDMLSRLNKWIARDSALFPPMRDIGLACYQVRAGV